jgi:hypothetical protein
MVAYYFVVHILLIYDSSTKSCIAYDPRANKWQTIASLPHGRAFPSIVALNDYSCLLIGEEDLLSDKCCPILEYDVSTLVFVRTNINTKNIYL